jgi:hypothetical protein
MHTWVTQAVRNLFTDLEDTGYLAQIKFLIRDRDAKYPELIDEILAAAALLRTLPQPLEPDQIERLTVDRQNRLGGVIHEYVHTG